MSQRIEWAGTILGIQPRIRLTRSFDQRHHSYLGYAVHVLGRVGDESRQFLVGVGAAAQERYRLEAGDRVSGAALPVADARLEPVDFYKVSALRVSKGARHPPLPPPPWLGPPPRIEIYRERGHRRLAAPAYERTCTPCIWGCRMPVEMIIDHWNPDRRSYRFETFCYGPRSCPLYRPGPTRKVPGRKGMSYEEEDWVDEESTSGRGPDD